MTLHPDLIKLAEAYGLETSYADMLYRVHSSPCESILAVLRMLGVPLDREDQAADALRAHRQSVWQRVLDPVSLVWDGRDGEAILRWPLGDADRLISCSLSIENSQTTSWEFRPRDVRASQTVEVEGIVYAEYRIPLQAGLPSGYHRFQVTVGGQQHEATVIAAPTRCYQGENGSQRHWGVFLPLYALRSQRDWGVGDFTDLGNLLDWTRTLGGSMVGALPLMASFVDPHDNIYEPSPYAPASRLFWNEIYLDVESIAASIPCPAANTRLTSEKFRGEREALRKLPLVDYRRTMALKRSVLEELAATFFTGPSAEQASFRAFLEQNPHADEYARFRATGERNGASWWCWPERQRQGEIRQNDFDEAVRRYHLFVQWQCHEQLTAIKHRNGQKGLYLDLPLGSSSDSYEVWRHRELFVSGASVGAPADDFAIRGQNWGFFPIHPQRQREQSYRFFRDVLGNMMQFATTLRIDHLAGMHRLFFIPQGASPSEGVFVRYPHEELYAIFCLESHRHRVVLMGEDAGVLPPTVLPAMERHQIHHLYMAQCYYRPKRDGSPPKIPENAVASLSTHDLATFASFWRGLDLDDRFELGQMDRKAYRRNAKAREYARILLSTLFISKKKRGIARKAWQRAASELIPLLPRSWLRRRWSRDQEYSILKSLLMALADSPARTVIVNLEDLWLSAEAQNVPGTWKERPNWQRRAAHAFEELIDMPQVYETLQEISQHRREETIPLEKEQKQRTAA
jgi:4-alpha-glucanotransferase